MTRYLPEDGRPASPDPNPPDDREGMLARLVKGIVGPPWRALKRTVGRVATWLDRVLTSLLEFWRNLFLDQPDDEGGVTTPPTKSSLLLAAVALGLTLYTWPAKDIFPPWIFIPACLVVLVIGWRIVQSASIRGAGSRWETWLRESERRAGLVWWERAALALSLAATLAAAFTQPSLIPLTAGLAAGFLVLLGQPPRQRELRTVRVVPPLPEPDVPPTPEVASEFVTRRFAWTVRHAIRVDSHELELSLHEPTYQAARANNPGRRFDGEVPRYADYIVEGTTPDIDRAAAALYAQSRERRNSTYEEVSCALAFVQSIAYSYDQDSVGTSDYWRFPIETLYDETGDCEDTTILAAALLRRLGHTVVALDLPGHAALGVEVPPGTPGRFVEHAGKHLYFCETTGTGWKVGEVPSSMTDQEMRIIPVPALTSATTTRRSS